MMKLNTEPTADFKLDLANIGYYSNQFVRLEIKSFYEAALHIKQLPYERCSWQQVIELGKGTCSSKHAILKAVAEEQGLDCRLMLGIYSMTEANTPGVGKILKKAGLESIPEAHCFIGFNDSYYDFTFPEDIEKEPITEFHLLNEIQAEDINNHKVSLHKKYIQKNFQEWELIWNVREACIKALFS